MSRMSQVSQITRDRNEGDSILCEVVASQEFAQDRERGYANKLESGENPIFRISAGLMPHKGRFLGRKSPLTSSKHGFFGPFPPQNQIRQSPVTREKSGCFRGDRGYVQGGGTAQRRYVITSPVSVKALP